MGLGRAEQLEPDTVEMWRARSRGQQLRRGQPRRGCRAAGLPWLPGLERALAPVASTVALVACLIREVGTAGAEPYPTIVVQRGGGAVAAVRRSGLARGGVPSPTASGAERTRAAAAADARARRDAGVAPRAHVGAWGRRRHGEAAAARPEPKPSGVDRGRRLGVAARARRNPRQPPPPPEGGPAGVS